MAVAGRWRGRWRRGLHLLLPFAKRRRKFHRYKSRVGINAACNVLQPRPIWLAHNFDTGQMSSVIEATKKKAKGFFAKRVFSAHFRRITQHTVSRRAHISYDLWASFDRPRARQYHFSSMELNSKERSLLVRRVTCRERGKAVAWVCRAVWLLRGC